MTRERDTLDNWRGFWGRLEKRKGVQGDTPSYTDALISWLFGELHADESYKSLAGWKWQGNRKKENDRLAIGIRPIKPEGRITRVAFSLFPDKGGRLLFLLYAVNAQEGGRTKDESALRSWVQGRGLAAVLSDCIFPGRKRVGREGDLRLNNPYDRYAKIAIRAFDGRNFSLVCKSPGDKVDAEQTVKVSAGVVRNLLVDQIRNRPSVGRWGVS